MAGQYGGCYKPTCFYWASHHGYDGDVDSGEDVDDGEDQVDLDGPVPFWMLPAQVGKTEHSQSNAHLKLILINCIVVIKK